MIMSYKHIVFIIVQGGKVKEVHQVPAPDTQDEAMACQQAVDVTGVVMQGLGKCQIDNFETMPVRHDLNPPGVLKSHLCFIVTLSK